jgi:general L-amino acid transport system permease protein
MIWINRLLTLVVLWLLWQAGSAFWGWAVDRAVFSGAPSDCLRADGACWAFVAEKHRLVLFGRYPFEQQWRPLLAMMVLTGLLLASMRPRPGLAAAWVGGLGAVFVLMYGGVMGLPVVSTAEWGGLALTLVLSVIGVAGAFPLAVLLALARAGSLPLLKTLSVLYIELVRGVPLISVLFMASVLFPLFLPEGVTVNQLLRAQMGICLFAAAYLAEVVRGGLQGTPKGQYEAGAALGLSYAQKMRLVILPQALRRVIPPMVNVAIGVFKDTSLVAVVGLFDLLLATRSALSDAPWRPFFIEGYLFIAAIYFTFSFSLSCYSQHLEKKVRTS